MSLRKAARDSVPNDTPAKIVAGGAGGAGLIKMAEWFDQPWRDLIVFATPAVVSLYIAIWPRVLLYLEQLWARYQFERSRKRALRDLDLIIATAKERLEAIADSDIRIALAARIAELEGVRVDVLTQIRLSFEEIQISSAKARHQDLVTAKTETLSRASRGRTRS